MRILTIICFVLFSCISLAQENDLPIIDMHLHALPYNLIGSKPTGYCKPWSTLMSYTDAKEDAAEVFMDKLINPDCDNPIWSPKSNAEFNERIAAQLTNNNVIAVVSGTHEIMMEWKEKVPERIIPAINFNLTQLKISKDSIISLVKNYGYQAFGEVTNQYHGIGVDDPRMDEYYALAQELDIPIGVHMGSGAPGSPMTITPKYDASLSNPLHLEKVLKKFPKLRVFVMHYGDPFIDEMITMMYHYPQLYVDLGGIQYTYPKEYFYQYHLKKMVFAGFGKRIMYGSDAMVWPELIEMSIDIIKDADFLSEEQKRDILYNNAARFLRLIK